MIKRHLENIVFHKGLGRQMRFIAGPRQVGKTTIAQNFLRKKKNTHLYFNWDLREVKDKYKKQPYFFETSLYDSKRKNILPWVCFDEIHKMPKWKNILKDYFDKFENDGRFIITGSAKLDIFRRSGDSLAGRYFLFKLLPLSLSEVCGNSFVNTKNAQTSLKFIENKISTIKYNQDTLDQLLNFSGFPEPFIKAEVNFHNKWQQNLLDRVIREDLRDLTKIMDLENIATVMQLLPQRIGSLLSYNSLKRDVDASYTAISNYISALELGYVIFLIPPFSRNISRSIKKERKCYFYDWSRCFEQAKRFENYVAVELKIMTELWNDQGIANFKLYFVRTKDGKETDFLITKNNTPWLLFEAKLQDETPASHHFKHSKELGNIPLIQLVHKNKVLRKHGKHYTISASRFF